MGIWLLGATCVVLAGIAVYYFMESRAHNGTKTSLEEYKDLFIEADALQKEGRSRVETLLQELGIKDVQLERVVEIVKQSAAKDEEIKGLQAAVQFQETQYENLFKQKKSSEVRLGQISEQIAPFLKDYPFDSKRAKFIGDPIDIISFDDDKITFIEVKSGQSQLSKRQRQIRDMIKEGKVDFFIYRIKGE